MKLPREYRKYIGKYDQVRNGNIKRILKKFGYGPKPELVVEKVAEVKKPKKAKKKSTK